MIKRVYSATLKNKPFLIIPHPFNDELFSSWLTRAAYAHHFHPQTFINLYFGIKNRGLFKNNVDAHLSDQMIQNIEKMVHNKINIFNLTLRSFSGILRENDIIDSPSIFLCKLRFCPHCLKENIPYFKHQWKLAFTTVCVKHQCFLQDLCPSCKTPLNIFKMYNNILSFSYCSQCGFDLKKSPTKNIHSRFKTSMFAINILHQGLYQGYIQLGDSIVYLFCFMDVVTQLSKLILSKRNFAFLHTHPLFLLLNGAMKKTIKSNQPIHLQLNIIENFALFGLILYLFEDYPNNFEKFVRMNHLTHWDMTRDLRHISFWYETLVNSISPRYVAFGNMVTNEEIKHARHYLLSLGKLGNKANLTQLFGNINFFNKYQLN